MESVSSKTLISHFLIGQRNTDYIMMLYSRLFRPFDLIAPKTLNYLTFQSFDFECTWWRLFQKRSVRTKFDIYTFIVLNNYEWDLYPSHNDRYTLMFTWCLEIMKTFRRSILIGLLSSKQWTYLLNTRIALFG